MTADSIIDPWFVDHLVCPRDRSPLVLTGSSLVCAERHAYPVVDGVPIMLLEDVSQTFGAAANSLARARGESIDSRAPGLYLESVEISDQEKQGVIELASRGPAIDPVVSYLVAATNGILYRHLIGRLKTYPIPELALPPGNGRRLLDVGCSWGRWTIAAALRGYEAIGIDPSLGAVMAARRVARQLGSGARFVVGDARHLPFAPHTFATVFSYSVIQHFSRADAAQAVGEIGRVLDRDGIARVQMPTRFGLRCLYHQMCRGFGDGSGFEVRYWLLRDLRRLFTERIGPSAFEVDGYFGIGLQQSDRQLMTPFRRFVLWASRWMTAASHRMSWLIHVADSVYVQSVKRT
ncbi:MAG TPA: methyltransferase domain-containing protein [Vicinamibacterales bacterium]